MREYYYLIENIQNGPCTIEELKTKGLTSETLIWFDGIDNWKKIKEVPELHEKLKTKKVPPPPPTVESEKKTTKTDDGPLNVSIENTHSANIETFKPSKKVLTWLICWCSFHLFILLMSYSQIEIFNTGESSTQKFWPFVEYQKCQMFYTNVYYEHCFFKGIFNEYDWTEFSFYVGSALLVYLIAKISNSQNKLNT